MVLCPSINRDEVPMDSSGYYFLIKPNFRYGYIEVAVCHPDKGERQILSEGPFSENAVVKIYCGTCAQDIYHEILTDKPYVTSLTHAAYLGKELKKAELALVLGIKEHYQE